MTRHAQRDDEPDSDATAWLPDVLYAGGRFRRGLALVCDARGRIMRLARESEVAGVRTVRLARRALLPGLVNAHSHAFQRVIRGRTEYRSARAAGDSFWTWREMMYRAAARLVPEDIYDASRMAFLEMAAGGATSVGEFHYLHRTPQGTSYDDPNLLAKEVVRAARDVGIRIALLRVAYARAGYQLPPNQRQARFIEPAHDDYLRHVERLQKEIDAQENAATKHEAIALESVAGNGRRDAPESVHDGVAGSASGSVRARGAWVGVAPHSVRAVPLEYLRAVCAFAGARGLPVHMHIAEQPAEVEACVAEYGQTPVALLDAEGLLDERFTGVHAVHITHAEAHALAQARATVCACPTTERNLGDGIVPADLLLQTGVALALGTDSHTQIDLLEDARELEYHLRLQRLARNVLAPAGDGTDISALAARLFACATTGGARSIGAPVGEFAAGRPADFFTVNLDDPSIAGAGDADLLASIVFSLARTAVREVAVDGRLVVEDGMHRAQEEIVRRFNALQVRLWNDTSD